MSEQTNPIVPADLFARAQVTAGLRDLADYLDNHPDIPVPEYGWELSVYPRGNDAEEHAEVDRIAQVLEVETYTLAEGARHLAARSFGRITYRAVAIPGADMAAHRAAMSYYRSVRPDDPDASSEAEAA